VATSVYHYGMPDLTSLSKDSIEDRYRLLRMVEETIAGFEPRLVEVKVLVAESPEQAPREFHFRIEGLLRMDPSPERVAFDTRLEIPTGKFALDGAEHA
jgi:type VI secretion system protein ImpF